MDGESHRRELSCGWRLGAFVTAYEGAFEKRPAMIFVGFKILSVVSVAVDVADEVVGGGGHYSGSRQEKTWSLSLKETLPVRPSPLFQYQNDSGLPPSTLLGSPSIALT